MSFNKVNNIVGWIVALIACSVYVLTMEPTGSFWDVGEFVSSAYKVQIPHPPGAPLFVLLGRLFIILFGDNPMTAAKAVNFMSAIASGFTILFLFWTITHFARKIVVKDNTISSNQIFAIMAAGVVGALAYTFSDSFWYSAVEGEVYALSSLFTAIVFWAILKWEHEVDTENKTDGHKFSRADRWLIFIFFMMGLSVGVHLLNLLTIPAIVMVYYFKRYKVTAWGTFYAFLIGCIITGITQVAIIQWSIKGAGQFDIFFVNELGTPFFFGFAFYFALLAALLIIGLRFDNESIKKFKGFPVWLSAIILLFCFPFIKSFGSFFLLALVIAGVVFLCYNYRSGISSFLKIGVWSAIFLILGYSTYFTTLIRSSADPSVDMFNVDNPVSLVGYLSREQYGDWPILYGPFFTEEMSSEDYVVTGDQYVKGENKYEVAGQVRKINYSGMETAHLFPRMWDNGQERNQDMVYREFGGLDQDEDPTVANNIKFLFDYQTRWMYFRYFMWNFAGKQNDIQGLGNIRDGNWYSGINFIDKLFHSTTDTLPDTAGKSNKANNKLYFLPLILGILGFLFQYDKNRRDFIVTFLLFFFTGFAIVIYLNQSGYQPRERDYAYVGSFYAFAIWIGLGVLWVREKLAKFTQGIVPTAAAFAICLLAVPVLMASQEWDDHDRSQKTLARDLGKNYLESVQPNSILFTFGDNDTYPLWYAQEVEGARPDLRVINYSLLGTDWYVNQLRYKLNQSAPADVIFTPEQIQGSNRDIVPVYELPGIDKNAYYDLYTMLKDVVGSEDQSKMVGMQSGDMSNVFPSRKVSIAVDVEGVRKNYNLKSTDSIPSSIQIDIQKNYLQKNDLALLAVIATSKFSRPIYFTSTAELRSLGLDKYLQMDGMAYRLTPFQNPGVDNERSYKTIMEKFAYGNASKNGVYYDEENRRHMNTIRLTHATLAKSLAASGNLDSAKKVLQKYDQSVLETNVPYGMVSNRGNFHNNVSLDFLEAAFISGDFTLAEKVKGSLKKDLEQQLSYYRSLSTEPMSNEQMAMQAMSLINNKGGALSEKQMNFAYDIATCYQMLMQIGQLENQFKQGQSAPEAPATLQTPNPDSSK